MTNLEPSFYLFEEAKATERERLNLQHQLFRPHIIPYFERVLGQYGLATRLQQAKARGRRLGIVDVGCGEGWYLHDLAELLQKHELLQGAELVGLDKDLSSIGIADELRQVLKPALSNLQFFVHDATQPFEDNLDLKLLGLTHFDFIFATSTLEYLPRAHQQIERFYQALQPGGLLYLRSIITTQQAQGQSEPFSGWLAFNEKLTPYYRLLYSTIAECNPGEEVASSQARWLEAVGAEVLENAKDVVVGQGSDPLGVQVLKLWIRIFQSAGQTLVARGRLSQTEYDDYWQIVLGETGLDSYGQAVYIDTIARKPTTSWFYHR